MTSYPSGQHPDPHAGSAPPPHGGEPSQQGAPPGLPWNDPSMRPPVTPEGDAPTMPMPGAPQVPWTPAGTPMPGQPWPPAPAGYAGAPAPGPEQRWAQPPMAAPDPGSAQSWPDPLEQSWPPAQSAPAPPTPAPPQTWPGQPSSGPPATTQPPLYLAAGAPEQQWPVTYPTSGPPMPPMSAPPASGPPQAWSAGQPAFDAMPWSPSQPASGPPAEPWRAAPALPPWSGKGLPQDPPSAGPRIVPSPPKSHGKLLLGLLIGAVAGILVAAPAGYFLHSPGKPAAAPTPSAAASAGSSLSPYETVRRDINKAKLGGDMAGLADPWLPYLGGCIANSEPNGPALNQGEKTHVSCTYGGISVHFATYESLVARDQGRDYHVKLNSQADNLAPGLGTPGKKNGTVTKASGMYIEYAYRLNTGVTICGLWWDRDDDTSGVTLEAICDRELDGKWEPLRDLWQRYS